MKQSLLILAIVLGFSTAHGQSSLALKCSDTYGVSHLEINSDGTMGVTSGILGFDLRLPIKNRDQMAALTSLVVDRNGEKDYVPEVARIDASNETQKGGGGVSRSVLVLNDACVSADNQDGNLAVLNSNQPVRLCCVRKDN